MNPSNIILLTDSYKVSHYKQYPPRTETIYSYFESRGGRFDNVVFFGLQYYLKQYLNGQIVTQEDIDEAAQIYAEHFGNAALFNRAGWEYILQRHSGRLPVRIKAVPEGSAIPTFNVMMTIENTDPACFWLTNFLETLLVQVWYGSTVATLSREIKKVLLRSLEETGDPSLVDFKLHDFGFRGVSSVESAGVGGAAHLINFMGTDTVAALTFIQRYYNTERCYGFSIPATEHSTITSWGKEHEARAYANVLEQYPEGLVACVSDSYDILNACDRIWGEELRDKVLGRKGTLVIRPDSGDPAEVILKVMDILGARFGAETNAKGFKVLHPNVRVIQGDGVDYDSIGEILSALKRNGWSADNIAFGMGGALLQKLHRDTQKFAFKCSAAVVNGEERPVFKSPVTDSGKNSKRGRLKLIRTPDESFATTGAEEESPDILQTVFEDGYIKKQYSFDDVKRNAAL